MREQKTPDALTEYEKALRKDGYRAGWNDRADHDWELIEDCNRPFKFTHFRPLKSIQKRPLNIYHLMELHAGDGKCANSGGLAYV